MQLIKRMLVTDSLLTGAILRITLWLVIFPHGAQKLFGWFGGGGYSAAMQRWDDWWGIPPWLTMLVIFCEFFGMLSLLMGFAVRFISVCYIIIMCGAIYITHWKAGFFMNWYVQPGKGEGFEFHLLVIGLCIALLVSGAGKWSFDRKISERF